MKKRLEFTDDAEAEYLASLKWYRERSLDAARKFETEVDRAVYEIHEAPQRWAPDAAGCRKFLLHQFPFAVIYEDSLEIIRVLAVAHCHRRPGYWRDRNWE